jgi:cytochrome c oxidase subunit 2
LGALVSVLQTASAAAGVIAEVGWVLIAGAALVFAGVMALLVLALRRGPAPVNHLRWLVGGGVVFPVVVLSVLLAYATLRSAQLFATPREPALVIAVEARMWWWQVRYRDPASGADVALANEIRVPVGRPVVLGLTSEDVIHSFWVPALAGKVDMVPGRVHQLRLQAQREGVFRGQCAEFCGTQHARMALQVVAMAPAQFDAWLAAQARPAAAPADAMALRGREVFLAQRCDACHSVRGIAEGAQLGPDLTHVASRLQLGAGTLPNGPEPLAAWVAQVQRLKPGARMPSYERLDAASAQALAGFLAQLQ